MPVERGVQPSSARSHAASPGPRLLMLPWGVLLLLLLLLGEGQVVLPGEAPPNTCSMAALSSRSFEQGCAAGSALTRELLARLGAMETRVQESVPPRSEVDGLVRELLFWLSAPSYVPTVDEAAQFLPYHPLIANLVALTEYKTTDATIAAMLRDCDLPARVAECPALPKALVLLSARNTIRLDYPMLFAWNPAFASLWYVTYFWLGYSSLADKTALANFRHHVSAEAMPSALYLVSQSKFAVDCLLSAYYMCTYIDPVRERHLRQLANRWGTRDDGIVGVLRSAGGVHAASHSVHHCVACAAHPTPRVLVVDAFWVHSYSSHRVVYRQTENLLKTYHVDLLRASAGPVSMQQGFRNVYNAPLDEKGRVILSQTAQWIVQQGYTVVFYPSISMDRATLWLAHLRLAPIQVASYGQPVSTYGSEIDYWLAGESVGPEHFHDYTERHVLLPGMGILHSYPEHYAPKKDGLPVAQGTPSLRPLPPPDQQPTRAQRHPLPAAHPSIHCARLEPPPPPPRNRTEEHQGASSTKAALIVNTQAAVHKSNHRWIKMLVNVLKQVSRPVTLRLFPNLMVHDRLTSLVFRKDLERLFDEAGLSAHTLGGHVTLEILCPPTAADFMALLRDGDLYLDSFPFGGCSSVMDALLLRQPVVSMSGIKYANRCGPAMLEEAGVAEGLVAHSEREYFVSALRLIDDDAWRASVARRMRGLDLQALFFDRGPDNAREQDYHLAISHLIQQHDQLLQQTPEERRVPIRVPALKDAYAS